MKILHKTAKEIKGCVEAFGKLKFLLISLFLMAAFCATAQYKADWEKGAMAKADTSTNWFKNAKFGLFIHWGLYSKLAGNWKNKRYYGSGEWIMHQAKISAAEYAGVAAGFNPVNFNAEDWAQFAQEAGFRYMVITAKHHEGFSMFDSKVSGFNIVNASAYGRDPMKALSTAARKRGIKFGFYYSQFLDWHEANGGGNDWDFDDAKKDYLKYYHDKSIPQIKELMSNYGPLGLVWFDMAGGLTKQQTQEFIDTLHQLQPNCLFSSRVGQGLGDYTDFGDSEVPPAPISGVWESIYTHNDSWGFIEHDMNFKSAPEIIRLLANVASKGGNLMLNVGPDGQGNLPPYSLKFLKQTGAWLAKNGESIYSTTYGFVPAQPWGVTTGKPGKLFLHVFTKPQNNVLFVPSFAPAIKNIYTLTGKKHLAWQRHGNDILVTLGALDSLSPDNVLVVEYGGAAPAYAENQPISVSKQYAVNSADAVFANRTGHTNFESITFSHYFGDWKHAPCITGQTDTGDVASFPIRVLEPGDYKVILEYSNNDKDDKKEGIVAVDDKEYYFRALYTSDYSENSPLLFIKHPVAIVTFTKAGNYQLAIHPVRKGNELFKLKTVILEPL